MLSDRYLRAARPRRLYPRRADFAGESVRNMDDPEIGRLVALLVGIGLQGELCPEGKRLDVARETRSVFGELPDDCHNFLLFVVWRPPMQPRLRPDTSERKASGS